MKSRRSISGEQKYYIADLGFYFATNTDYRINYGPVLENITYIYAKAKGYAVSVGRIGKLECDFIMRNEMMQYSYVQVALVVFERNETGNAFWESQGFTVRNDLVYRNKSLVDIVRIDT